MALTASNGGGGTKEAFFNEAIIYIHTLNQALVELEINPDQPKIFQEMIRAIHALKSLAGTMNYVQSMNLCQTMEAVLDKEENEQY